MIIIKIDNFTMTSIWSRFRAVIYPIMSVCLSIPDQICCKIRNKYFWVHFNGRPNFVTVQNLYWTHLFKYITTNHDSIHLIVFRNFLYLPCSVQPLLQAWFYWSNQGDVEVYSIIPCTKLVNTPLYLSNTTMYWFLDYYLG